jgi:glycosyltransferase involved in cell wall biosynthesis
MERCAFRFGDVHTAVSKTQCEHYAKEYGVACEYIPTAANLRLPAAPRKILELGLRPGRYVLFASRLVSEKRAHDLVRAFSQVETDADLVLAGEGPETSSYVHELRRAAAPDRRVRFLGHVTGPLLDELFSNAAAFVQPSEIEGLAIAVLEAMSFGNVVIASDIPENLEALGGAGISFRCGDSECLAAQLRYVLCNPVATHVLGRLARARVAEHYSWDAVAEAMERLYVRRLQETGGARASLRAKRIA